MTLDFSANSKLGSGFGSGMLLGSKFSVESRQDEIFSYMIAASRENIRKAREERVEVLAAAESEDQYHQSFLKYSVLIMSSNTIVA